MATRANPLKAAAKRVTVKKIARKVATPAPTKPKADKPAKVKLVRDSFTIPKNEFATLDALKKRAARSGIPSKKSEILRAGVMALAAMEDAQFKAAIDAVPRLKTGRPNKH